MVDVAMAAGKKLGREVTLGSVSFHHGEPETLKALARLAQGGERPITTDGGSILRSQDERLTLAQGWRRFMASRQTRDTMHLIVSSRPGTDRTAFVGTTRTWLKDTFGRHEYIFTTHDNTAHTHVHALVVMRTRDRFERLRTSPAILQVWRERFAERARERGIAMFAERRLAKGQARPTVWRGGERPERSTATMTPKQPSEAGLMAAAQGEWIETLRTIETAHAKEPGAEAAAVYARGVIARLEAGLAAWRSQSRNTINEKVRNTAFEVDQTTQVSSDNVSGVWPATLASIDGLIRNVEGGMVTEVQARQALRDTHGRIMKLAVMSRSAETRARFTTIANDINDRGNQAVTIAVERRQTELERERSGYRGGPGKDVDPERPRGTDDLHHHSRGHTRDRIDHDVRRETDARSIQADARRKDRERERD
jgi:hypothetical protein